MQPPEASSGSAKKAPMVWAPSRSISASSEATQRSTKASSVSPGWPKR